MRGKGNKISSIYGPMQAKMRRHQFANRHTTKKKLCDMIDRYFVLRIILYGITFGLCVSHVKDCVDRYYKEPIGANVDILDRFSNYTFPTILLCPHEDDLFDHLLERVFDDCRKKKECSDMNSTEFNNYTVNSDNMWNAEYVLEHAISTTSCGEAINEDCNPMQATNGVEQNTVRGRCFKFYNNNTYRFISTDSYQFSIRLENLTEELSSSVQVYFSTKDIYRYNLEGHDLADARINHVHLSVTQFSNVNAKHNLCQPEAEVINCLNNCMASLLEKTKPSCTLPFCGEIFKSYCPNPAAIKKLSKNMLEAYMKRNECKCKRPCTNTIYNTQISHIKNKPSSNYDIHFSVGVPKTLVTEFLAYPFSSLTAEVLSHLGFFMGLSLFHIFHAVPFGLKKVMTAITWKKKDLNRFRKPRQVKFSQYKGVMVVNPY